MRDKLSLLTLSALLIASQDLHITYGHGILSSYIEFCFLTYLSCPKMHECQTKDMTTLFVNTLFGNIYIYSNVASLAAALDCLKSVPRLIVARDSSM